MKGLPQDIEDEAADALLDAESGAPLFRDFSSSESLPDDLAADLAQSAHTEEGRR